MWECAKSAAEAYGSGERGNATPDSMPSLVTSSGSDRNDADDKVMDSDTTSTSGDGDHDYDYNYGYDYVHGCDQDYD